MPKSINNKLKIVRLAAAALAALSILTPATALAGPDALDISSPQCRSDGSSLVAKGVKHYKVGIVGVNKAGDFDKNTCLGNEIKHFDHYSLYAALNYTSDYCHKKTNRPRHDAFDCGEKVSLWNLQYASSQGAYSDHWYEDVEIGTRWDSKYNDAFLYGVAKALESRGITVGFYSTSYMWGVITDNWKPGGHDWYATGPGKPSDSTVRDACNSNFTGGKVVYYQFIGPSFDLDNKC
jgi:hypothetical protein